MRGYVHRMPMPHTTHLLVRDPVTGSTVIPLRPGERLSIGRAPTNQLVLHDEQASRYHAEIAASGTDGWSIRDLGSRNGTMVDGELLQGDRLLAPGTVVVIGRAEIVACDGEPASDSTGAVESFGTSPTGDMPADLEAWHAAILHRRGRSRLRSRGSRRYQRR